MGSLAKTIEEDDEFDSPEDTPMIWEEKAAP